MYPDNDVPGERLFLQLQQVLPGLVRHQLPPGCKDYSEYYLRLRQRSALLTISYLLLTPYSTSPYS